MRFVRSYSAYVFVLAGLVCLASTFFDDETAVYLFVGSCLAIIVATIGEIAEHMWE
jgi:hypothetical protein